MLPSLGAKVGPMWRMLILAPLICALMGCGGAPSAYEILPSENETHQSEPISPLPQSTSATVAAGPTPTFDFILLFTPAPTETALPPLELPLLESGAPSILPWDGRPTYLAESQPGYYFRVLFDPGVWALTRDASGLSVLGHREIAYCIISPSTGRGLPLDVVVEHETRRLERMTYEVNTVFSNGQKQLVTYVGGDGLVVTGFEVIFRENEEVCLSDAESLGVAIWWKNFSLTFQLGIKGPPLPK
jgi:hypothetical protein